MINNTDIIVYYTQTIEQSEVIVCRYTSTIFTMKVLLENVVRYTILLYCRFCWTHFHYKWVWLYTVLLFSCCIVALRKTRPFQSSLGQSSQWKVSNIFNILFAVRFDLNHWSHYVIRVVALQEEYFVLHLSLISDVWYYQLQGIDILLHYYTCTFNACSVLLNVSSNGPACSVPYWCWHPPVRWLPHLPPIC